jgi:hypothetical protein
VSADELAAKDARIAELEASIAENERHAAEIEREHEARFAGARADGGQGTTDEYRPRVSRRDEINEAFMDAIADKRHGRAMRTLDNLRSSLTPKRKGKP